MRRARPRGDGWVSHSRDMQGVIGANAALFDAVQNFHMAAVHKEAREYGKQVG